MALSFQNALAGAGTGATVGSAAGPWGTAGGGILGFLAGLFSGEDPNKVLERFPPEIQQQLLQQVQSAFQGNPQGFAPIEEQARNQFQQQTIPSLAERFTSMGNSQRSSAFQGALGQAGAGLETGLAALKSQYGMNQIQSLLPFLEQNYQTRQPGFGENLAVGGAQALPALLQLLANSSGQGMSSQPTSNNSSSMQDIFKNNPFQQIKTQQPFANVLGGGKI